MQPHQKKVLRAMLGKEWVTDEDAGFTKGTVCRRVYELIKMGYKFEKRWRRFVVNPDRRVREYKLDRDSFRRTYRLKDIVKK